MKSYTFELGLTRHKHTKLTKFPWGQSKRGVFFFTFNFNDTRESGMR